MKRLFDVIVSAISLVMFSPLLLLVALLIKIFCGGSVLFTQTRIGRHNIPFKIVKFRTMQPAALPVSEQFEAGDISRVTTLGAWLRKTKIDELPQLINVLKGDMSLVGPRPEIQKWVEIYPEAWEKILQVRPGITDPAAILYRHEERILAEAADPEAAYRDDILPKKLVLYQLYIDNRSLVSDIIVILKTIVALGKRS